ncbi:MAG: aminotransferase class V-fold PLP-dependent enzyme, partial [Bacilli bacterium]|nr:aminotransferase class V-fold PLP-dependent enzyme [Bacilli bacterium]
MKRNKAIYFDNAATTCPSDEVVLLYNRLEKEIYGNPNSIHHLGIEANKYLSKARDSILESFNVKSHQVIFTSSSTEANNLAIKGYCLAHQNRGNHIIT